MGTAGVEVDGLLEDKEQVSDTPSRPSLQFSHSGNEIRMTGSGGRNIVIISKLMTGADLSLGSF